MNCSPCSFIKKENFFSRMVSCAQVEISHGEQFLIQASLCLIILSFPKIQGKQICEKVCLYLNPHVGAACTTINGTMYPRFHSKQISGITTMNETAALSSDRRYKIYSHID